MKAYGPFIFIIILLTCQCHKSIRESEACDIAYDYINKIKMVGGYTVKSISLKECSNFLSDSSTGKAKIDITYYYFKTDYPRRKITTETINLKRYDQKWTVE